MKRRYLFVILLATLLLTSCGTSEEPLKAAMTLLAETEAVKATPTAKIIKETVEVTVIVEQEVEVPVTVTYTPGPTATPTITNTPAPSPTPFNTYGCVDLRSPGGWFAMSTYELSLHFDLFVGDCVALYYDDETGPISTNHQRLSGYSDPFNIEIIIDKDTSDSITDLPTDYSMIWGFFQKIGPGEYEILLRSIEKMRWKGSLTDGSYLVGEDMLTGVWLSLWNPNSDEFDDCFWTRSDPDTGEIKESRDSSGFRVKMWTGEKFETEGCAPWIWTEW